MDLTSCFTPPVRYCPLSDWATRWAAGLAAGMPRLPGASWAAAVLMAPETPVPELDEAAGVEDELLPLTPLTALVACADEPRLAELAIELPISVVSVELIEINCCRLFTFTSWLMYSLGSVLAVGSWFFISVTKRVRKSLAEMVAELLVVLLELLVASAWALELLDVAAMGFALAPVRACAAAML
jgi:hypothetical protein